MNINGDMPARIWMVAGVVVPMTLGCMQTTQTGGVPGTVPTIDVANFSNPTNIDNSFFPLSPGATRTYRATTPDGIEDIVVEVLSETREVMGITCRVVRDQVSMDGALIEDTFDWYAQDDDGNVWYMGEEVDNYNYDDAGELVDITSEGSWEAGLDVAGLGTIARPGYLMPAAPTVGNVYHQEYYAGEAEEMGEIVALDVPITLSSGTKYSCLQTLDTTPLEPALREHKYYAPGVGVVLETHLDGSDTVELISIE